MFIGFDLCSDPEWLLLTAPFSFCCSFPLHSTSLPLSSHSHSPIPSTHFTNLPANQPTNFAFSHLSARWFGILFREENNEQTSSVFEEGEDNNLRKGIGAVKMGGNSENSNWHFIAQTDKNTRNKDRQDMISSAFSQIGQLLNCNTANYYPHKFD